MKKAIPMVTGVGRLIVNRRVSMGAVATASIGLQDASFYDPLGCKQLGAVGKVTVIF